MKVNLTLVEEALRALGWDTHRFRTLMAERRNERGYLVEIQVTPENKVFWTGEVDFVTLDAIKEHLPVAVPS